MKYCPGLSCPHRSRVRKAAEFLDTVAACSDCGAELVSELDLAAAEIALATRGVPGSSTVYRKAQRGGLRRRADPGDLEHAQRVARASLVGGVLFLCMGCGLVWLNGGRQNALLLGPILYAAYCFVRDRQGGEPKARKSAKRE